ncbi:hypothetical protein FJZ21_02025 [Candidatus Pacearchaeota archaeon]|nr:hypothetical protein [Candidatus Pacearchaeota archaeon]
MVDATQFQGLGIYPEPRGYRPTDQKFDLLESIQFGLLDATQKVNRAIESGVSNYDILGTLEDQMRQMRCLGKAFDAGIICHEDYGLAKKDILQGYVALIEELKFAMNGGDRHTASQGARSLDVRV